MRNYCARGNKYRLAIGVAAIALAVAGSNTASAAPVPAPGQSGIVQVNIAAGDLGKALTQLGREAGVQIAFLPDRVRGRKAKSLRGSYTVEQALERLLDGTGLRFQKTEGGSYIVGGPTEAALNKAREIANELAQADGRNAEGKAIAPDILVVGTRNWTINLDIPRTRDDALPYVTFSHEQIQRSGATSLDDFFRDNLPANNTPATGLQTGGITSINLRGQGANATLVLVDGRRYSPPNIGDGNIGQGSVNGIPLDAIERIEVLPSSAAGIYGSNAVGGVVNIIMRRDYRGIDATAYYGAASDLKAGNLRLSLNGSFPLEGGKTHISFTGEYQKTNPLNGGDRDFIGRARAFGLAADPDFFADAGPLLSTTPNILNDAVDAQNRPLPLILKPQYGGASLGASTTYVSPGFAGVTTAGSAALAQMLIANAGKQNTALAPTSQGGSNSGNGAFAPLLNRSTTWTASATVKRDFTSWLSLYLEGDYSYFRNAGITNAVPTQLTLPASAPYNPFTTAVEVTLPGLGQDKPYLNESRQKRILGGAIVKLPYGWRAAIDLAWTYGSYHNIAAPPPLSLATQNGLKNGTIDILKDGAASPVPYVYQPTDAGIYGDPAPSFNRSYSLKLSGPTPWLRLWGGKPQLTLLLERDRVAIGDAVQINNNETQSNISYSPFRFQDNDSAYAEVSLPVLSPENKVPFMRALEFQISGRYDHYKASAGDANIMCQNTSQGLLSPAQLAAACPLRDANGNIVQLTDFLGHTKPVVTATTRNGSFNPVIAGKWTVSKDIAFRGSYTTGYQPPFLASLISSPTALNLNNVLNIVNGQISFLTVPSATFVNVTDPQRNHEAIGANYFGAFHLISATVGGNADVKPQTSKTWSFGTIITPRFVPGLRISVDWTRIRTKYIYFSPTGLLAGGSAANQADFEAFLAAYPERFKRDPLTAAYQAA